MATQEGGAEAASPVASATQTLSQFVARVLDQLSLSAWLPSAALVLLLDFTFHLGAVLDSGSQPHNPADITGVAVAGMGRIGVSGAVLLVIAVAVLTMLTQAFAFEAIRVLRGLLGYLPPGRVGRISSLCHALLQAHAARAPPGRTDEEGVGGCGQRDQREAPEAVRDAQHGVGAEGTGIWHEASSHSKLHRGETPAESRSRPGRPGRRCSRR